MGLDSMQLVMGFEEAFGVEFEDDELERLLTPRMAIDLTVAKLNVSLEARSEICPTLRAYNRLRQASQEVLELPRWCLLPESQLQYLLARYDEPMIWEELRNRVGVPEFPSLRDCLGLRSGPASFQGLVDWVVAKYPRAFLDADEVWTVGQVRSVLRAIVRRETGTRRFSDDEQWMFLG
jgi:hypothetical protein